MSTEAPSGVLFPESSTRHSKPHHHLGGSRASLGLKPKDVNSNTDPDTPSDLQSVLLQLREGQRCLKTKSLTWILYRPIPTKEEGSAGPSSREGSRLVVVAADRASGSPGVTYADSPRWVCSGPRCVSHSPARPARRAGRSTGGGPWQPTRKG